MTFARMLEETYTDGIAVLHRGKLIYERYFGALDAWRPHIAWSVTKSFFGTLGEVLVAEGKLDENAPVSKYIPELKDTAFGDATVRQVLDMTVGVKYSENYADPKAEIIDHIRAGGLVPRPAGYAGPTSFYGFLKTLQKDGQHGEAFAAAGFQRAVGEQQVDDGAFDVLELGEAIEGSNVHGHGPRSRNCCGATGRRIRATARAVRRVRSRPVTPALRNVAARNLRMAQNEAPG